MDITSHSSNHGSYSELGRYSGWCFLCHKQRLSVLGSTVWETVFCYMGHCPFVPIPEGFIGSTKPYPYHRHCLVHTPCFYIFLAMGANRSFHLWCHQSCIKRAMWHQLLVQFRDKFFHLFRVNPSQLCVYNKKLR